MPALKAWNGSGWIDISGIPVYETWKPAVRVATTANITLSGTQTIDGVAVVANDRVLVKNQTAGAENGIYVVAAGAWARAGDSAATGDVAAAVVAVEGGTANGATLWRSTLTASDGLGTTSYNWLPVAVTLTDSTSTTSSTTAASATAVKSAYDLASASAPKTTTISTTAPLSGGGDLSANRTLSIADASTSVKGAVQLTDSTSSTSTTTAATPNSVKSAYDLAGNHIHAPGQQSTATLGNDFSLDAGTTVLRYTGAGAATLTGMSAAGAAPQGGRIVTIVSGGGSVTIQADSTSSTAAYRIMTAGYSPSVTVGTYGAATFVYDASYNRWKLVQAADPLNLNNKDAGDFEQFNSGGAWTLTSDNTGVARYGGSADATLTSVSFPTTPRDRRLLLIQNGSIYKLTVGYATGTGSFALGALSSGIVIPAQSSMWWYWESGQWLPASGPLPVFFTGDSGSGGTAGIVPAPAAGDAAAGKFLKASGAWDTPAPKDATYVVIGGNSTLSAERTLTQGTGITISDQGANSTVTVAAKLTDSTATTDSTTAASATAVKAAKDAADAAQTTASAAVPKTTTLTGTAPITVGGVSGSGVDLSANRTIAVTAASTTASGVVQLQDTYASNDSTKAATVTAAKSISDAAVQKSTVTAAGDLIVGTGNATVGALARGGAGTVLTSTGTTLAWAQAGAHTPVRAATTAAGTLASSFANGQAIDGITLATGDRILVKNQAAPAENGIYTVNATGAPTRAIDADIASELAGEVPVLSGTTNGGTLWMTTLKSTNAVGTDAMNWFAVGTLGSTSPSVLGAAAAGTATTAARADHVHQWADTTTTQTLSLAADVNELTLNASTTVLKVTPSSFYNIHGITGGYDGRRLVIVNETASTVFYLPSESATCPTASSRITTAALRSIKGGEAAELIYDSTRSRWVILTMNHLSFNTFASQTLGVLANSSGSQTYSARYDHVHDLVWMTYPVTGDVTVANSTTMTTATGMSLTVAASAKISIRGTVFYDTTAAGDFKYQFVGPTSPTLFRMERVDCIAGGTPAARVLDLAYPGSTALAGAGTTGGYVKFEGLLQNGANAGTFAFQFAQNSLSNDTGAIVRAGSYMDIGFFA